MADVIELEAAAVAIGNVGFRKRRAIGQVPDGFPAYFSAGNYFIMFDISCVNRS